MGAQVNAAAATVGVHTRVVWSGEGINYSKGQRTRLLLLERARTVEVGNASPGPSKRGTPLS
jgi:hypothetical protein